MLVLKKCLPIILAIFATAKALGATSCEPLFGDRYAREAQYQMGFIKRLVKIPLILNPQQPTHQPKYFSKRQILVRSKLMPLEINFQIVSPNEFANIQKEEVDQALWFITTPSGAEARVKSGHLSLLVGNSYFERNVDQLASQSMTSKNLPEFFNFVANSTQTYGNSPHKHWFLVAQNMDLPREQIRHLEKFFHDRVWHFHAGEKAYQTTYEALPLTKNKRGIMGVENCVSFANSFLESRWINSRPEIESIKSHFQGLENSEIPFFQMFLNSLAHNYRGSLLIVEKPDEFFNFLKTNGINNNLFTFQMLGD